MATWTINSELEYDGGTMSGDDISGSIESTIDTFPGLAMEDLSSITRIEAKFRVTTDVVNPDQHIFVQMMVSDGSDGIDGDWEHSPGSVTGAYDETLTDGVYFIGGIPATMTIDGITSADGQITVAFEPTDPVDLYDNAAGRYFFLGITVIDGGTFSGSSDDATVTVDELTILGAATIEPFEPDFTPEVDVALELWNEDNDTKIDDIGEPIEFSWQERENAMPAGSMTVLLDHEDPVISEFTEDRKIRIYVNETPPFLVGTFLVEDQRRVLVTDDEEAGMRLEVTGRGLMAEWERAVWLPYGGLGTKPSGDSRVFNWACPEYDYSGWSLAYSYFSQVSRQIILDPPLHEPWFPPKGWPTHACHYLWPINRGSVFPPGRSYLRGIYTLGSDDVVTNFFTGDGRARLFLNGLLAVDWTDDMPVQGFLSTVISTMPQTAGVVHVGLEIEVYDDLLSYGRPPRGMGIWCAHLERSTGIYNSSSLLGVSNPSTWRGLDQPALLPAPSPGRILRAFMEEAQADSILTGWTRSFSDLTDSAGQPWATQHETSFKLGMNGVKTLEQMASESIDVWVQPALKRIHAWNIGTRGASSSTAYSTANGNLRELIMERGAA